MTRFDPSKATRKYREGTANGAEEWKKAVNAVDVDPTQKAAEAAPFWQQRVSAAETRDRYVRGLQNSGKNGWLAGCNAKGVTNYQTGTQAGENKYQAHMQNKAPVYQAGMDAIKGMAKGTLAASKARAGAWIDFAANNLKK